MEQSRIDRINALGRKAKTPEGLTEEEHAERAVLRTEYVAAFKANLWPSWTAPSSSSPTEPAGRLKRRIPEKVEFSYTI